MRLGGSFNASEVEEDVDFSSRGFFEFSAIPFGSFEPNRNSKVSDTIRGKIAKFLVSITSSICASDRN